MISCPNCGKSVAEDAAHCGHCGHKLEQATSQKTMMGFALSSEDLQKAIQEAGQRREEEAQPPVAAPQPQAQEFSIDEMARTEILPSIDGNSAFSDTLDPDSDLASSYGFSGQQGADSSLGGFDLPSNVEEVVSAPGGFSEPSFQAPFPQSAPMAAPSIQSMAPMQSGSPENQGGEESFIEKNKKMLIIAGAVFAVLFGCCILSTVYSIVF